LAVPAFDLFYIRVQPGASVTDVVNPNLFDAAGNPHHLGDVMPDFTVNFDQELNYGPARLSAVVQWNKGGVLMNQTELYYDFGSLWGDSAYAANWAQKFNAGDYNWIEGAGFVKVRSVALSYTLPSKWISGFAGGRFSSLRLALEGRNLLHWYGKGYTGLDPEVAGAGNQNLQRNIEITPYPPARSYFLSLDLGF
jgi:hypothetical protein